MITILEKKPVPTAEITCPNCGSKLEYGNADLRIDYSKQSQYSLTAMGMAFRNYKLTCPVCGVEFSAYWIQNKGE